ncbi:hypothetical protein LCGC14_2376790, partial [marine sediment metagenome]
MKNQKKSEKLLGKPKFEPVFSAKKEITKEEFEELPIVPIEEEKPLG